MNMCKCNERYIELAHAIGEYEGIVSSLEFDLKEKDIEYNNLVRKYNDLIDEYNALLTAFKNIFGE